MTDADQKAAIRDRMASTGENYTTAKRAIEPARLKAQSEQPDSTRRQVLRRDGQFRRRRVLRRDGRLQPGRELDAPPGLWLRFRYVPPAGRCHAACVTAAQLTSSASRS